MIHRVEMTLEGRVLSLETGRVAEQAGGAVMARYGDTVVLAAATASSAPRFQLMLINNPSRVPSLVLKLPTQSLVRKQCASLRCVVAQSLVMPPRLRLHGYLPATTGYSHVRERAWGPTLSMALMRSARGRRLPLAYLDVPPTF